VNEPDPLALPATIEIDRTCVRCGARDHVHVREESARGMPGEVFWTCNRCSRGDRIE
jgi:phage/plasmid primase-like uncharacterized protein